MYKNETHREREAFVSMESSSIYDSGISAIQRSRKKQIFAKLRSLFSVLVVAAVFVGIVYTVRQITVNSTIQSEILKKLIKKQNSIEEQLVETKKPLSSQMTQNLLQKDALQQSAKQTQSRETVFQTDTQHQRTEQKTTSNPINSNALNHNDDLKSKSPMEGTLLTHLAPKLSPLGLNNGGHESEGRYLNIGLRQDYLLQECTGSNLKQSFPDIDYVFLGYNILRGFPLAVGHDPGFTYPIFVADYSGGGQTGDCRYSVPHGLVVIPDVSCVTSFSSTTVETQREFSKALSLAAQVQGGGWGISFAASAGYKQSSSEMSSGEFVYILSTAKCNYYFTKLIEEEAPKFNDVFLNWVYKLNKTSEKEMYMQFLDKYGTHFPAEVTFGARFTYEHKMSSKKFQQEKESGVNVGVQASFSGAFSVGGGFNMDSSQRQAASHFSKSVETRTITVGAPPPADGNAMTWASNVQTYPVPSSYKLKSIENLFSDEFMGHLGVNNLDIANKIKSHKIEYCQYLRQKGEVQSCHELYPGKLLENTYVNLTIYQSCDLSDCIGLCLHDSGCDMITYCTGCYKDGKRCYLHQSQTQPITALNDSSNKKHKTIIFNDKIKHTLNLTFTSIIGIERGFVNKSDMSSDLSRCHDLCLQDEHCDAYSWNIFPSTTQICRLFTNDNIFSLEHDSWSYTVFLSPARKTSF